jgi:hypothetical protein
MISGLPIHVKKVLVQKTIHAKIAKKTMGTLITSPSA